MRLSIFFTKEFNMNKDSRVPKWITEQYEYKPRSYKSFVELCYYLVRKYGAGEYNTNLGRSIRLHDTFVNKSEAFMSDYDISSLLGLGEEMTEEQKTNRQTVMEC